MSDTERVDNNSHTSPPTKSNAHSRRDFLRRAGKQAVKEAVEMGVKVVPGGAIVQRFVNSAPPDEDLDSPEKTPSKPQATLLQNPLQWFAAWRDKKGTKTP